MQRRDILIFQLREIVNEFADALAGLTQEQWIARPLPGQNPIAWIACHCINNVHHFVYRPQTGRSLLGEGGPYAEYASYATKPPRDADLPDFAGVPAALTAVFTAAITTIEHLDDAALDEPAPHWYGQFYETSAGNCLRVINHSNTHLRDIWMLHGAMGDREHFPIQTLYSSAEHRGAFFVPDRATILADRARRRARA